MKGISEIIATILILLIVVGLAGTAYTYISSSLTSRTTKQIDVLDVSCSSQSTPQQVYITIKNLDPKLSINTSVDSLTVRGQSAPIQTVTWNSTSPGSPAIIGSNGGVVTANFTPSPAVTAGSSYNVRIVGPSNAVEKSAVC